MGMHREPLPMACPRKNQQKVLAKNQLVGKRQDPQEPKEPVIKP